MIVILDHDLMLLKDLLRSYSVDKYYRLSKGMNWFSDEQPSDEIKQYVKEKLDACGWKMDLVLSHTCPQKYVPIDYSGAAERPVRCSLSTLSGVC